MSKKLCAVCDGELDIEEVKPELIKLCDKHLKEAEKHSLDR